LALLLRNGCKLRATAGIPCNVFKSADIIICKPRTFTQLASKNVGVRSQWKDCALPQKRNMSADHSKLWPIEKVLAAALAGIVPAMVMAPNAVLDNAFALISVVHMHWGLEACAVDYVRPIIFGPAIPKLTVGLVYLISAFTLGALIFYNFNDIGIGRTVRKFWAIKN